MNMIDYVKMGLTDKYSDFSSRSTRPEFWWFQLGMFLASMVLMMLFGLLGFVIGDLGSGTIGFIVIFGLVGILGLGLIIPSLAITVRRLHDSGKSGWYYLFALIPYIGGLILLVLCIMETEPRTNKWGPIPGHQGDIVSDALIDFDRDVV